MKTTTMSAGDAREALELRLDAYLDGLLSPSETRATERMLAEPEVAAALAEAIALRELLAHAPSDETPPGLAERIIEAIGVEGPEALRVDPNDVPAGRGRGRGALFGAGWMVRGPAGARGAGSALAGVGTLGYALQPLTGGARDEELVEAPRAAWWRPSSLLGRRRR